MCAGLDRLGWANRISEVFTTEISLPAVGQGAIAVEARVKDTDAADALVKLDDAETRTAIIAERALLASVQGGCQVPLGAWARIEREELILEACVCSTDGKEYIRQRISGAVDQPAALGEQMAKLLLEAGAMSILEGVGRANG